MKQLLLFFIIICFSIIIEKAAFAQQQYLPINNSINDIIERGLFYKGDNFHTSIKPYREREINQYLNIDSVYNTLNYSGGSAFLKSLLNKNFTNLTYKYKKSFISANLLLCAEGEYNKTSKDKYLQSEIGANVSGGIGKNFSFSADIFFNNSKYYHYIDSLINLTKTIPNEGNAYSSNLGYFYKSFMFYLSYSPSKYFNFEAGKGKNFWGDGYHTTLLSDYSNSYPYFKITTTFWRFKYVNLFARLSDLDDAALGIRTYNERYTAMHYLSWNISRRLNISFFEAVMFKGRDTTGRRGYDINYLNPVIFYRPVEFSLGSPDNELMGTNINLKISHKSLIYFQLMLDEFVLYHIRHHDGWWANKQAFQLGYKTYDIFGLKNLSLQAEYNFVRPYTYTHFNVETNYSNFNQPLAIPLGANLMESIGFLHYRLKRFQFQLKYNVAKYGADQDNQNNGQNIFKTNEFLGSFKHQFKNYVGQGFKNVVFYKEFNVSYTVNPRANLIIEAGIMNRNQSSGGISKTDNYIYFGIRTLFENRYFDF